MPHSEATSPLASGKVKPDSTESASPSSYLGLNYAVSPRSTPKSVSISRHTETISPLILGQQKEVDDFSIARKHFARSPRQRRLSGRPSNASSPSLKPLTPAFDGSGMSDDKDAEYHEDVHSVDALVDQVSSWIKEKREKRHKRKAAKKAPQTEHDTPQGPVSEPKQRRGSDASDESVDLDRLERIIKHNLHFRRSSARRLSSTLKTKPSVRRLLRKQSSASDSDQHDIECHVPSCDAFLDNSKTLAYTGGASDVSDESEGEDLKQIASLRDHDAWAKFKFEIVRLAHTLRLKGWKKVPLEMSSAIEVQRLSGALTNAVYVVSPPTDLPLHKEDESGNVVSSSKPPPKLLLRVYGPNVEHLIDRESELAILRRLARKRIGPRLLGTFANGRFEEYLHAKPLVPEDLRDPGTSRQIAKRMRELHEGIELLDQERSDGAFVWRNWDKWLSRVEQIVTWMDAQVKDLEPGAKPTGPRAWMRRGHICGVPWQQFKEVVDKYRSWLLSQYGGSKGLQEQLVFAHNDTQYGNILRMVPTGDSPLLLPANSHKQLIVIDFEYSNANTPGLEFANHFTEWCYNYHDERRPHAFHQNRYPTPEEQDRFIRAYVRHRPQFNVETPKMGPTTPTMGPGTPGEGVKRSTTSISDFILDARNPQVPPSPALKEDASVKAAEDAEVERLRNEARMWRLANTAQWVVWGLVQAKVPGMPMLDPNTPPGKQTDGAEPEDLLGERAEQYRALAKEQEVESEEQEEFDYLGYAQHRALFFWGDAIQMGFIKAEDLPEETRGKVKTVPH
ncbi:hypothetical protein M409DRAFT_69840 [Zasmidium cellare ATCC 36951]|uniref:Choline kinase N-terminal domain-containing protein n=1 Tax=Zasmidium cellare ATCC 36951 TaxID=1080233 RepID=A0A6A6C4L8_ZASCE|nr:uncharacterized protein M409DRAFT_69840 [Zasmidium cellare ATCC 36951]KAF2161208.1 hypothetical protein M409DRAFT_69840 [Zasmidium cellare ATCC 36951]